jgi:hypothetical protein
MPISIPGPKLERAGRGQAEIAGDPLAAKTLMDEVSALALGHPNRIYRTYEGHRAGEYLIAKFEEAGLLPLNGSYTQPFEARNERIASSMCAQAAARNLVGWIEGSDPQLKDEVVLVTAHYDTQPGTREGANDNATGCAAILAIAEMMKKNPPKRSVAFILFDGEECGRLGSRHYAQNPLFPLNKTALMLNIDMIGQVHLESGKRSEVYQWASNDGFAKQVLEAASKKTLGKNETAVAGYPEQPYDAQFFTTDAEPLWKRGVPIVNLLSGRDLENHSQEDRMYRVIPERLAQYTRLAHAITEEASSFGKKLVEATGFEPGGLMPSYPLISARKTAISQGSYDDFYRVRDMQARIPQYRAAAHALVEAVRDDDIFAAAGTTEAEVLGEELTLLSESVLNRVREMHAGLTEKYHGIGKNEVEERKTAASRLTALAGIEGILSGALFVAKLNPRPSTAGDYQTKRLPDKLKELFEGAHALGIQRVLKLGISEEDLLPITSNVSPDHAFRLVLDNIPRVLSAVKKSVHALIDPHRAIYDERDFDQHDLAYLREELSALERYGDPRNKLEQTKKHASAGEATVALDSLLDRGWLKNSVKLAEIGERLVAVKEAAAPLPGGAAVAAEIGYWLGWLDSFKEIEPLVNARDASKNRAIDTAWGNLLELWRGVREKLPAAELGLSAEALRSPGHARQALIRKPTILGDAWARKIAPYADLEISLADLAYKAHPETTKQIARAVESLALALGEPAVKTLRAALEPLKSRVEIEIGQFDRNLPLGVLRVKKPV